ncbi:hypothetical protein ACFX15_006294 [Malus domestica]
MVAAVYEATPTGPPLNPKASSDHHSRPHLQNPSRPHLLPSEKDNGLVQKRPRGRQVSSKYMSYSPSSSSTSTSTSTVSSFASSRRCPYPLLSRSINSVSNSTLLPARKKAQSVDRRQPITPQTSGGLPKARLSNAGSEVSAATQFLQSMIDESRIASFDGRLSLDLGNAEFLKDARQNPDANSAHESSVPSDLTDSDTDSVSFGSTSGVQDAGGAKKGRTLPRGIAVSARFNDDVPLSLSFQTMASPTRVPTRPASSGKLLSSSSLSSVEDEMGLDQVHASTGGLMTSKEVVAELMSDDLQRCFLQMDSSAETETETEAQWKKKR